MKYLLLIHLDEDRMNALSPAEMNELNRRHIRLNEELRASGHLIEAEALSPAADAATLQPRSGKLTVVDGPYAETKELVAGFYLIEAADRAEAFAIAARLPSAPLGRIEIRPTRRLIVDGQEC